MEKFNFKKSLGQNFISDKNIINKIVDTADIDNDTLVIEIGPGAGAISEGIISKAGYAILYEIDDRLESVLRSKFKNYDNYKLYIKDILSVNLSEDIKEYNYSKLVVVANIPYYITSPIITKLINEIKPDRIVIMIQEEVANRICSKYGNREYGLLSVMIQSMYYARMVFKVGREWFTPKPNVDSAIVRLDKRNDLKINDYSKFIKFIQDSFRYKRKNIKNNLSGYDLDKISNILSGYNLSITDRSEDIPVECFVDIVNEL